MATFVDIYYNRPHNLFLKLLTINPSFKQQLNKLGFEKEREGPYCYELSLVKD